MPGVQPPWYLSTWTTFAAFCVNEHHDTISKFLGSPEIKYKKSE